LTDIGDLAAADAAVSKIREVMAAPVVLEGQRVLISLSVGVALYPEDGHTARSLLGRADSKMYEQKRSL
jgi:GGDEF domain-containing protein